MPPRRPLTRTLLLALALVLATSGIGRAQEAPPAPSPSPAPDLERARVRILTGKIFLITAGVNAAVVVIGALAVFARSPTADHCGMFGCPEQIAGTVMMGWGGASMLAALAVGIPVYLVGKAEERRAQATPRVSFTPFFTPSGWSGGMAQLSLSF